MAAEQEAFTQAHLCSDANATGGLVGFQKNSAVNASFVLELHGWPTHCQLNVAKTGHRFSG